MRAVGREAARMCANGRAFDIDRDVCRQHHPSMMRKVPISMLAVRLHLGLSQRDFADLMGRDQSTYHKWERRNRMPTPSIKLFERIIAERGITASTKIAVPKRGERSVARRRRAEAGGANGKEAA